MTIFITILVALAIIATVVALVRGIIAFLKTTEQDLKSNAAGPSVSSIKQNRMMMARIGFQALAVVLVMLLLILSRG